MPSHIMLHYCKLLCTRSFAYSIPRVCTSTRSHPPTRFLQSWSATHQEADSKEEDERDFDKNSDAVLGDFSKYDLSSETVRLLRNAGVNHLFEVQYKTYKEIREGIDVFVQARTGEGKTLGFALPIIEAVQAAGPMRTEIFPQSPQVLALAPTEEFAIQIAKEFEKFAARTTKVSCFYGGVSMSGEALALHRGVDILVGTPGRILAHLMNGKLNLSTTRHVILDESDRMVDMGFQKDVEDILAHAYTEENRPQTLLFSATLPPWVLDISRRYTSDNMQQFDLIPSFAKSSLLVEHKNVLCSPYQYPAIVNHFAEKYCDKEGKALVLTQTNREAENLVHQLKNADYITSDSSQNQREKTLKDFRGGCFNVLVATDVAARGLDIPKIDFVLQTCPPKDVDAYISQSGQAGSAEAKGLSIILYGKYQFGDILLVEEHAGIRFTEVDNDPKLQKILDTNPGKYKGVSHDISSRNYQGGFHRRHSKDLEGEFGSRKSSRAFSGEYNHISPKPLDGHTSGRDFQGAFNSEGSNSTEEGFDRRNSRNLDGEFNSRISKNFREFNPRSSRHLDDDLNGRPSTDRFSRQPSRKDEEKSNQRQSSGFRDLSGENNRRSPKPLDGHTSGRDFQGGFNSEGSNSTEEGFDWRNSRNFDGEFNSRISRNFGEFNPRSSRHLDNDFNRRPSTDRFSRQLSRKAVEKCNQRQSSGFRNLSGEYNRRSPKPLDGHTSGRDFQGGFNSKGSNSTEEGFDRRNSRNFDGEFNSRISNNFREFNPRSSRHLDDDLNRRPSTDRFSRQPSRKDEEKSNQRQSSGFRDLSGAHNRRSSNTFDGKFSRTSTREIQESLNSKSSNPTEKRFKGTPSKEFEGRSLTETDGKVQKGSERFSRQLPRDYEERSNQRQSGGFRDFSGEYNRMSSKPFDGKFSRTSTREFQGSLNSKGSNSMEERFNRTPSKEFEGRSLTETDGLSDFSRLSRDFGGFDGPSEDQESLSSEDLDSDSDTYKASRGRGRGRGRGRKSISLDLFDELD